jgi:outer membrane immunogenic protein
MVKISACFWGAAMKRLATVGAAIASIGTPAFAADMAVEAPLPAPVLAPAPSWTGFYIGGDLGGAWSNNTATFFPFPSPADFGVNVISAKNSGSSVFGGVYAGYNWQFAPAWVAGLEGDWSWTHAGGFFTQPWTVFSIVAPISGRLISGTFTSMSSNLKWVASIRGRFGYLVTPTLMAYATGGAAWARIDYAANDSNGVDYATSASASPTQDGFVVGGGLEWAATEHWLLRAEYLYYRFGNAPNLLGTFPISRGFPSGYSWSATNVNVVRGGVSYKF